MSMIVNAATYRRLVEEDIEWLLTCPRTLERDHVLVILQAQIRDAHLIVADDDARFRADPNNQP